MKTTIATTLVAENQYSTVPNQLTLRALTAIKRVENATIHSHAGGRGNQKCM
jgi:hypothetical protein